MIWFLLTLPLRLLGFGTKLSFATVRVLGVRRLLLFGGGVAVGLLVAPGPGAELRRKLREAFEENVAPVADLADRVRDELSSSPRTWHLPQPVVTLDAGRVVLAGEVPHAAAAADLERAARTVAGVTDVEIRLRVVDAGTGAPN